MKIVRGTLKLSKGTGSCRGVHSESRSYERIEIDEHVFHDVLIDNLELEVTLQEFNGKQVELYLAPYKHFHTRLEVILVREITDTFVITQNQQNSPK